MARQVWTWSVRSLTCIPSNDTLQAGQQSDCFANEPGCADVLATVSPELADRSRHRLTWNANAASSALTLSRQSGHWGGCFSIEHLEHWCRVQHCRLRRRREHARCVGRLLFPKKRLVTASRHGRRWARQKGTLRQLIYNRHSTSIIHQTGHYAAAPNVEPKYFVLRSRDLCSSSANRAVKEGHTVGLYPEALVILGEPNCIERWPLLSSALEFLTCNLAYAFAVIRLVCPEHFLRPNQDSVKLF